MDNKYTWMVEIERLGLPQLITNYFALTSNPDIPFP